MELRDYLRIARRRWLSIGAVALIGALLAFGITTQITPKYASTSGVFISTTPSDTSDAFAGSQFSQQRVTSYADVVSGLELAQRVIDELDLRGISAEDLSDEIEASVVPDTVVLRIVVTDPSPQRAQQINEAVVSVLRSFVSELETPPGATAPLLKATLVDTPRLPDNPVSPQPLRNIGLGLLAGLLLGGALAVAREAFDTTVRDLGDVPALENTPILATMAYDSDVKRNPLTSSLTSHAPRAEAFRVLGTNLSFIDVDRPSKVLVITSSVPGEGKSTTAANAAIALAAAGQRTILVDGDLRRPQVARLTGLEQAVGLTSAIVGRLELSEVVQRHEQTGLDVLTSGQIPPNPAELLQSQVMQKLVEQLRSSYDAVIIDAPPLLPVTDAALLAAWADGAVLVVHHGKTTKDQVSGAVSRLAGVGVSVLGVVSNMVRTRRGLGRTYGYGYGYGYGYAPEEKPAANDPRPTKGRRGARRK